MTGYIIILAIVLLLVFFTSLVLSPFINKSRHQAVQEDIKYVITIVNSFNTNFIDDGGECDIVGNFEEESYTKRW